MLEQKFEKDKDFLKNHKTKEFYDKIPAMLNTTFIQVHNELLKQQFDVQLR